MKTIIKITLVALLFSIAACGSEKKEEENDAESTLEKKEVETKKEVDEDVTTPSGEGKETAGNEEVIVRRWKVIDLTSPAVEQMPEDQRASFNQALQQMIGNAYMEFKADGTFEGSLGPNNNTGTWTLSKDGTKLVTNDVNGRAEELEVLELTNERLIVEGAGADNLVFKMTLVPAR